MYVSIRHYIKHYGSIIDVISSFKTKYNTCNIKIEILTKQLRKSCRPVSQIRNCQNKKTIQVSILEFIFYFPSFSTSFHYYNVAEDTAKDDMWTTALPARPGSDLLTRMLSNDNYVKDIVVKAVIGKGICGDAQYVGSEERHDGRRNDVVYYPLATPSEELCSVIMEIQMNVTKEFVSYVVQTH
ncbi:uncharacterized protein EV154DRAFT_576443 [Mucor mucedo]|uniref:uncharacterized protein n=1 Tax=Mucor mucedo TaxID=29922 RepID=UPI00221F4169|nr:uncharacterized protein EV154DRAFT_576443 [Mucor mucedo]KAI7878545.1 hypothetical protein EV154DRAFT_576443 [Mucor mucedo]